MANKLFLVCTSLALCFLLTNASIYRTVVEVDEDDDTNPIGPFGPRPKCRKEFQQAQHLRACQQFIRKQARRQSRGWPSLDDDELDFEDDIEMEENRKGGQGQMQSPLLQQCCSELRQEDQVCVCPTLKRAARALSLQGGQQQQQGHQMRQIFQTAKYLPKVCNIPQVSVCPFRIPSFPPQY